MSPQSFSVVRIIPLTWSPLTESNRRPSPYHGPFHGVPNPARRAVYWLSVIMIRCAGLVASDACGVHPAARAQVVAREVDAADRLLKHGLPAVPARGRERDAFRPALHLYLGHQSRQLREDRDQIPQEHAPDLINAPVQQRPSEVASAVDQ